MDEHKLGEVSYGIMNSCQESKVSFEVLIMSWVGFIELLDKKWNFWIVCPFIFQTSFMGISWKYKLLACACAFVKQRNVLVKLGFRPRTQVASVQKALFVSNLLPIYLRHRIREREGRRRRKRRSWMAEEEGKESSISEPIMGWLVSAWHTRFHFYPWSRSLSWAQGLYWIWNTTSHRT